MEMNANAIALSKKAPPDFGPDNALSPDDFADQVSRLTFGEMVRGLSAMERLMELPDHAFDPKSVIGSLVIAAENLDPVAGETCRQELRSKVDAIHFVVSELQNFAARKRRLADHHMKKARAAENRAQSFLNYIGYEMEQNKFEKITGNDYVLHRKKTHVPSLNVDRDAEAEDKLRFDDLVIEVPTSYIWKNDEIKNQLKNFYKAIKDQPDCLVCEGKTYLVFESEPGIVGSTQPCECCAGTGKLFPDGLTAPAANAIGYLTYSYSVKFEDADKPNFPEKKAKKPRAKK